jgi:hypothetical protein
MPPSMQRVAPPPPPAHAEAAKPTPAFAPPAVVMKASATVMRKATATVGSGALRRASANMPANKDPGLTALVPASVRVRREQAAAAARPRPVVRGGATGPALPPAAAAGTTPAAAVGATMDASYMDFMADMKSLGAL